MLCWKALLGSVLPHQETQKKPVSKLPLPASPEGCRWDSGQGPCGPGEAGAAASPPPCIQQSSPPPKLPGALGWGKGVNAENLLSTGYLELLLSSVIIQHQLFLLLAADHWLPGWRSLSPLKRRGQSRMDDSLLPRAVQEVTLNVANCLCP